MEVGREGREGGAFERVKGLAGKVVKQARV